MVLSLEEPSLLPENQNDAWSLSLSVQPIPITEAAQWALLWAGGHSGFRAIAMKWPQALCPTTSQHQTWHFPNVQQRDGERAWTHAFPPWEAAEQKSQSCTVGGDARWLVFKSQLCHSGKEPILWAPNRESAKPELPRLTWRCHEVKGLARSTWPGPRHVREWHWLLLSPPINWCGRERGTQGPLPLARGHLIHPPS